MDVDARKMLGMTDAAYIAAPRYAATVDVISNGLERPIAYHADMIFGSKDRIYASVREDGRRWLVNTAEGTLIVSPVTPSTTNVASSEQALVARLGYTNPPRRAAMAKADPHHFTQLSSLFGERGYAQELLSHLQRLSIGDSGRADGVPVINLEGVFRPKEVPGGRITLTVGKTDHLLRRVVRTYAVQGQPVQITETYTGVTLNPTAAIPPVPSRSGQGTMTATSATSARLQIDDPAVSEVPISVPGSGPLVADIGLVVLDGGKSNPKAANRGSHDFALVSVADKSTIEHDFVLRNTSTKPIVLQRLAGNCGCVSVRWQTPEQSPTSSPMGQMEQKPITLPPGQEIGVQMTIDLLKTAPGPVRNKYAMVWAAGQTRPVASLQMGGISRPLVSLSSEVIDFKAVRGERTEIVTATFDTDVRNAGVEPELISRALGLTVKALPDSATGTGSIAVAAPKPRKLSIVSDDASLGRVPARPGLVRRYAVTVAADAPIGYMERLLAFTSAKPATTPAAEAVLRSLQASAPLVRAQVGGGVTITPNGVAFGAVTLGKGAVQHVLLQAENATYLQGARFGSGSPWLSVGLWPQRSNPDASKGVTGAMVAGATADIELSVSPDAPPGLIRTQVQIVLSSGRRIILPVNAFVK